MKIKRRSYVYLLLSILILSTFFSCLSVEEEETEQETEEVLKFESIEEAQTQWLALYNDSSFDIEQVYTMWNTSYLHSKGSEIYEKAGGIASYLSTQPFGTLVSHTSLHQGYSDGNYFEYGFYQGTSPAEKFAHCTLWVKENGGFRKEMEIIIKNELSDTENVSHITDAYTQWNDKISIPGNIDDFFESMYDPDIFYYNSYIGQSYSGFENAKNVYRQWIGSGLQIGTPEVFIMENFQEDISMLFTNWKQGAYQGHAFILYKKQSDGTWKTLVEFD